MTDEPLTYALRIDWDSISFDLSAQSRDEVKRTILAAVEHQIERDLQDYGDTNEPFTLYLGNIELIPSTYRAPTRLLLDWDKDARWFVVRRLDDRTVLTTYAIFGPWGDDVYSGQYIPMQWRIADADGNELATLDGRVGDAEREATRQARIILGEK